MNQLPPMPLPESLWGEQWCFASVSAGDILEEFGSRSIPFKKIPDSFLPIKLGLAVTVSIPGVIIYGGKQSLRLARWLNENNPVSLNYIPGAPDGLILQSSSTNPWIVATFTDIDVTAAGKVYQQRKKVSGGVHFLLVQPDHSGITFTGFWLLKDI